MLTVTVQRPGLVNKVLVYSGLWSGACCDANGRVPGATVVAEKALPPSGTTVFSLTPGDYFVDASLNNQPQRKQGGGYGSIPQNVHLDQDWHVVLPIVPSL